MATAVQSATAASPAVERLLIYVLLAAMLVYLVKELVKARSSGIRVTRPAEDDDEEDQLLQEDGDEQLEDEDEDEDEDNPDKED